MFRFEFNLARRRPESEGYRGSFAARLKNSCNV